MRHDPDLLAKPVLGRRSLAIPMLRWLIHDPGLLVKPVLRSNAAAHRGA